jgi:hypothetical protein
MLDLLPAFPGGLGGFYFLRGVDAELVLQVVGRGVRVVGLLFHTL